MVAKNRLRSAVLGAVVTVVLSFTALSPIAGGGVAGILRGGDRRDGLEVGVVSGIVATFPFLLLTGWFGGFLCTGSVVVDGLEIPRGFVVFVLFGFVLALHWTLPRGRVASETDLGSRRARDR